MGNALVIGIVDRIGAELAKELAGQSAAAGPDSDGHPQTARESPGA